MLVGISALVNLERFANLELAANLSPLASPDLFVGPALFTIQSVGGSDLSVSPELFANLGRWPTSSCSPPLSAEGNPVFPHPRVHFSQIGQQLGIGHQLTEPWLAKHPSSAGQNLPYDA